MAYQGDVEIIGDWKRHTSIDKLKKIVEEKGYSAVVVGSFGHAALKSFDYQLTKEHCKPSEGYTNEIHIWVPSGEAAKPPKVEVPDCTLVMAHAAECVKLLPEVAQALRAGRTTPLLLASPPGYAIVPKTDEPQRIDEWGVNYQQLGIGPASAALQAKMRGKFLLSQHPATRDYVLDVPFAAYKVHCEGEHGKLPLAMICWDDRSRNLDADAPRTFVVNADNSISPTKADPPGLWHPRSPAAGGGAGHAGPGGPVGLGAAARRDGGALQARAQAGGVDDDGRRGGRGVQRARREEGGSLVEQAQVLGGVVRLGWLSASGCCVTYGSADGSSHRSRERWSSACRRRWRSHLCRELVRRLNCYDGAIIHGADVTCKSGVTERDARSCAATTQAAPASTSARKKEVAAAPKQLARGTEAPDAEGGPFEFNGGSYRSCEKNSVTGFDASFTPKRLDFVDYGEFYRRRPPHSHCSEGRSGCRRGLPLEEEAGAQAINELTRRLVPAGAPPSHRVFPRHRRHVSSFDHLPE